MYSICSSDQLNSWIPTLHIYLRSGVSDSIEFGLKDVLVLRKCSSS